ncbi:MAG: hypothetical protein GXO09_01405 [Crenarchaeota archaeon]|nr:hypothetical protein [Thermoproteota archaeon]
MRSLKDNGDAELAARIAEALRTLGFFVFQRGVDDPRDVTRVLNRAGVVNVLEILMAGRGIYVVVPSERACRANCRYHECREAEDEERCIEECMEKCTRSLALKASEALERLAGHARGAG